MIEIGLWTSAALQEGSLETDKLFMVLGCFGMCLLSIINIEIRLLWFDLYSGSPCGSTGVK